MRDFLSSLKIRVKLLAAFGSILLLSVLLIFFSVKSIDTILVHKAINEEVDQLKLYQETLDLSAREFLHEGFKSESFLKSRKDHSTETFETNYLQSKKVISAIQAADLSREDRAMTSTLMITLDSLNADFQSLQALLAERGFRDHGSEGTLRAAIHKVENSGFNIDKVAMLTLRRHEKDFFLRKDLKYRDEFNNRIAEFRSQLETDASLAPLLESIDSYRREFNNVVEIEKQIGLKESEGIRGQLRQRFKATRTKLDAFRSRIRLINEAEIFRTKVLLTILFVVQIIAGLAMAIVYANLLTKSIKEIRGGMQQLAAGIFPDKLNVRTTEEIGQTKIAFNQFVDRLKTATTFASTIGSGDHKYDERFADDVLAKALVQAQHTLAEANARQSKINWSNQGIASFNDILKNETENIHDLSDKIISQLVETTRANQGALYLLKKTENEEYLERTATYAYGKKKYQDHRIEIGDGLIGQCVLEADIIYLKEVPRDFVKITSGLGEATPRNVLIVPLKVRSTVMGVIELASFSLFEAHEIEFVERIAESIASILSNKQTAAETKRLLEESQLKANALAQQDEEMRQNSEELQATQEEMERQRTEMLNEIRILKKEVQELRHAASVLI